MQEGFRVSLALRMSEAVSCKAHNLEINGSTPLSATMKV